MGNYFINEQKIFRPKYLLINNKTITKYNPKGLSRQQLGMNSHQYKVFCKTGAIV